MDMLDAAPRVRTPRGPYRKTHLKRQAILDAGAVVFATYGYRAGSLRDIAARVSMSEAGLLHHYPTKGALLTAVLRHRDDQAPLLNPSGEQDGLRTLTGLVALARYDVERPGIIELHSVLSAEATASDHPAHDYYVRRYAARRENLRLALERVREDGQLKPGVDPYRAAVATIAIWDGLQLQWLLDRDSLDLPTELAAHLQGLLTVPLPL